MKKKKIAFVINYFYPDPASTGQLMTELCLDLQDDFDITVIATQPESEGEKLRNKKVFEIDYLENIKITRIKLPQVNKSSKISRIKYIFTYFILANIALIRESGIDLIYTISTPPVLGGLIGTIGKFIKRTKHIYNIQDFNPEQAEAISYTNKTTIYKIARKIDNINCSYADNIIVVGQDMVETLKKRFPKKNLPKYEVINNWTNEQDIIPLDKENKNIKGFINEHKLNNKFIVMYSGNLGLYYDLENIIKITKHFKDNEEIAFVFIGEGAVKQKLVDYVDENKISNVHFLSFQPKEYIKYSLNAADVHLVVNQKGIKGISVPSKIYGVMAAGKPILGVLEKGSEAQFLIEKSNCGYVVEPKEYIGIIKLIDKYYKIEKSKREKLGMNGRKYLVDNLRREISINKYRETLAKVLE